MIKQEKVVAHDIVDTFKAITTSNEINTTLPLDIKHVPMDTFSSILDTPSWKVVKGLGI